MIPLGSGGETYERGGGCFLLCFFGWGGGQQMGVLEGGECV